MIQTWMFQVHGYLAFGLFAADEEGKAKVVLINYRQ